MNVATLTDIKSKRFPGRADAVERCRRPVTVHSISGQITKRGPVMRLSRITSAALLATGALMFGPAQAQITIPLPAVRGEPVPAEQRPNAPAPPAVEEEQTQEVIRQGTVLTQPLPTQVPPGRRSPPRVEQPSIAQSPESCKATEDTGLYGCVG